MKIDLQKRREEIAEELGISIDLVTVYPYREPKGTMYPTPWQLHYAEEFIRTNATTIYTFYTTVHRERLEEVILWLKMNGQSSK